MKGPKNFSSDQTVFHRDDVPATKRERKKEVKEVSPSTAYGVLFGSIVLLQMDL